MTDSLGAVGAGQLHGPGGIGSLGSEKIAGAEGTDFRQVLMECINEVNRLQSQANQATEQLTTGQVSNADEVLSAVRKADIAFSLLMQIRNQLLDAYAEVRDMRL